MKCRPQGGGKVLLLTPHFVFKPETNIAEMQYLNFLLYLLAKKETFLKQYHEIVKDTFSATSFFIMPLKK